LLADGSNEAAKILIFILELQFLRSVIKKYPSNQTATDSTESPYLQKERHQSIFQALLLKVSL